MLRAPLDCCGRDSSELRLCLPPTGYHLSQAGKFQRSRGSTAKGAHRRYTNGVVSNGVVSKKPDLQMVAKPAPEIFRIQGTYHNKNKQTHNQGGINRPYLELWRDKPALLIRPGLVRPGLCCSK